MINPFDRDFFKFLIGFVCILLASFVILYLVNNYQVYRNNIRSVPTNSLASPVR